jgi:hypothetical protein
MTSFKCEGCRKMVGGIHKVLNPSPTPFGYCELNVRGGAITPHGCQYGFDARVKWKRV